MAELACLLARLCGQQLGILNLQLARTIASRVGDTADWCISRARKHHPNCTTLRCIPRISFPLGCQAHSGLRPTSSSPENIRAGTEARGGGRFGSHWRGLVEQPDKTNSGYRFYTISSHARRSATAANPRGCGSYDVPGDLSASATPPPPTAPRANRTPGPGPHGWVLEIARLIPQLIN